jgi:hypothetical protein
MGAWGYGVWENDGNRDMLLTFADAPSLKMLKADITEAKRKKSIQWVGSIVDLALVVLGEPSVLLAGAGDSDEEVGDYIERWGKKQNKTTWKAFLATATAVLEKMYPKAESYGWYTEPTAAEKRQAKAGVRAVLTKARKALGTKAPKKKPAARTSVATRRGVAKRKARAPRATPAAAPAISRTLFSKTTAALVTLANGSSAHKAEARKELKRRGRGIDGRRSR